MKEWLLHIHVNIMPPSPQEHTPALVLIREKQGFFTAFASLLYAALSLKMIKVGNAQSAVEQFLPFRRIIGVETRKSEIKEILRQADG